MYEIKPIDKIETKFGLYRKQNTMRNELTVNKSIDSDKQASVTRKSRFQDKVSKPKKSISRFRTNEKLPSVEPKISISKANDNDSLLSISDVNSKPPV